jgi:hypothetical protein
MPAKAKSSSPAGNVFWKSPLWKRQIVSDVSMLGRQDMFKPTCMGTRLLTEAALTDCQEYRQVTCPSLEF